MLVHGLAEARRTILLAHVLVIRDAREQVVALGRDVRPAPLLALQRHVALFLLRLEVVEEDRHAVPGRMLQGEGDEDEAHTELTQIVPGDRALLVVPLERGRIVESEASLGKALADLAAELLRRPTLSRGELAPQ